MCTAHFIASVSEIKIWAAYACRYGTRGANMIDEQSMI